MQYESLPEHETEFAAMKKVTSKLGISPEAIRWITASEIPKSFTTSVRGFNFYPRLQATLRRNSSG